MQTSGRQQSRVIAKCAGLAVAGVLIALQFMGGEGEDGRPEAAADSSAGRAWAVPTARAAPAPSAAGRWTEDLTRRYYNYALRLEWGKEGGDWVDADGKAYGDKPFAKADVPDVPKGVETEMEIDVTNLVRRYGGEVWLTGHGIKLMARESGKGAVLRVTKDGRTRELPVLADGGLHMSTVRGAESAPELNLSGAALLRFDQSPDSDIKRALLRMTVSKSVSSHPSVSVFAPKPQSSVAPSPVAASGTEADVLMRLRGPAWMRGTLYPAKGQVNADGSLTMTIPTGTSSGGSNIYIIPKDKRRPVMFARMVMTLHPDFTPDMGGKLPGLANTGQGDRRARKSGWGGRTADGTNWSARTNRFLVQPGARAMGFSPYAYRVNRKTFNGEGDPSAQPMPIGRPFVLDQMVKLNSIGPGGKPNADGEIVYWLDGRIVSRMTGVIWRSHAGPETLPSEFWLDVYVGGTGYKAPHPHRVTFHEVTISSKLLPFSPTMLARLNG